VAERSAKLGGTKRRSIQTIVGLLALCKRMQTEMKIRKYKSIVWGPRAGGWLPIGVMVLVNETRPESRLLPAFVFIMPDASGGSLQPKTWKLQRAEKTAGNATMTLSIFLPASVASEQ